MDTQKCRTCEKEKALDSYYADKTVNTGIKQDCKECYNKKHKKYYAQTGYKKAKIRNHNRRKALRQDPDYVKKERENGRIYNATFNGRIKGWRASAKRRGISWNLTKEFLRTIPLECYYTGEALTLETNRNNTISIERIDSAKPYEEGNVVFCCADINRMKQEFSHEYFLEMCGKVWMEVQSK